MAGRSWPVSLLMAAGCIFQWPLLFSVPEVVLPWDIYFYNNAEEVEMTSQDDRVKY